MLVTAEGVKRFGDQIASKQTSALNDRTFVSFYGASPEVLSECFEILSDKIDGLKLKHLLWCCMFMKLYLPEDVMCILLSTSKPTFRKWTWAVIEALANESATIICWEKRKRNLPDSAICSVSVDGTDFKVQEPSPFNPKMKSHKFNGSALKYEVAISIFSGDIVWVYGPHEGSKHDITIFRESLKGILEDGEMVEADQGYRGEEDFIRVKDDYI